MIVLQYLYVAWASLLFIGTLLVAFILLMLGRLIPGKLGHSYTNGILRAWCILWTSFIFLRVVAVDRKKKWGKERMVIVTNHGSYLDTVASYITIPHLFKTLAKKELLKLPLMGQIFLTSGIMVDRSSPESRKASFKRMVNALEGGTSILIYPEGTQNRTAEPVRDFYDGAFRLAIEAQVPIMPIATYNSRWLMPQAKIWELKPGTIRQYYFEPVPTVGLTQEDLPHLRDKVKNMIEAKLREVDKRFST